MRASSPVPAARDKDNNVGDFEPEVLQQRPILDKYF